MNSSSTRKALIFLLLASCMSAAAIANAQVNAKPLVPDSLTGMKMSFKDLHGNYTVTFTANGSYSFTSSRDGQRPETRTGKYEWKVMSGRHAVLTLDDNEIYKLTFDSANEATGWAEDDFRPYAFHFHTSN